MKNARFVGLVAATLLVSMGLYTRPAQAVLAAYAARASAYSVDFARAMDQCTGSVTVVGGVNACSQANTVTDDLVGLGGITAHLTIRKGPSGGSPKLTLSGTGFLPPANHVSVQLTLRTTNTSVSSPPPASKTFADTTVICGKNAGFTCGHYFGSGPAPFGRLGGSVLLKDCVTGDGKPVNLAVGNIEIQDAALINCDDGKVIAVPGVRQ